MFYPVEKKKLRKTLWGWGGGGGRRGGGKLTNSIVAHNKAIFCIICFDYFE